MLQPPPLVARFRGGRRVSGGDKAVAPAPPFRVPARRGAGGAPPFTPPFPPPAARSCFVPASLRWRGARTPGVTHVDPLVNVFRKIPLTLLHVDAASTPLARLQRARLRRPRPLNNAYVDLSLTPPPAAPPDALRAPLTHRRLRRLAH